MVTLICSLIAIACNLVAIFFLWRTNRALDANRRTTEDALNVLRQWDTEGAPSARVSD